MIHYFLFKKRDHEREREREREREKRVLLDMQRVSEQVLLFEDTFF
jgi:hypothetical protein